MNQNPTPNPTNSTIKCDVEACSHHSSNDYCSLNQIEVGASSRHVTQPQNTECASFELDNQRASIYGQGNH